MDDYRSFVVSVADAAKPKLDAAALRERIRTAAGIENVPPCELSPRTLRTLERDGYRVELMVFQSRPDVWVTASLYVPTAGPTKKPAVLAVHGHFAWGRIDPAVQAPCVGLVKLGFIVLCVDAFGAGERHSTPASGTYHGALDGAALWPAGLTLLGVQLHDNRRAIDYLLSRPDVDGERLGVTGASGGGNQSMYAGAMDERIRCVVPVCSVGTYRSYLQVACCVCEVLPGALTFAEVGDVLGLIAPRPLMVVSASRDSIQFSPAEAAKSVARLKPADTLRHVVVPDVHGYTKPMREAMYGWMCRWLKGEGDGSPLSEPKFETDAPDALRCFPDPASRPQPWLTAGQLARRAAKPLIAENYAKPPAEAEEWESTAVYVRGQLRKLLGGVPGGKAAKSDGPLQPEPGIIIRATYRKPTAAKAAACVLLHPDGRDAALTHPLATAWLGKGYALLAPTLRATGELKLANDAVRSAADHNSAEYGVWVGRPLLGQWLADVQACLDRLAADDGVDRRRVVVAGVGALGVVAIVASALFDERVAGCIAVESPTSFLTDGPYPATMRMGVLAPGILRAGDVPHLAALSAPRRLALLGRDVAGAFAFTEAVYKAHDAAGKLTVSGEADWGQLVAGY